MVVPRVSYMVDYEGELAMVVGRRCKNVPVDRALDVIAGFTVMNDVSVRDWQWRTPTFTMGKSFDTHGPMGPWIVTPDEVDDPQDLAVRTWVNGELRQDSSTSDMIFSCAEQIAYLSTGFTLEAGDVISTGTPAGVGASFDPPRWLVPGDIVRISIDGVGTLENPVVSRHLGRLITDAPVGRCPRPHHRSKYRRPDLPSATSFTSRGACRYPRASSPGASAAAADRAASTPTRRAHAPRCVSTSRRRGPWDRASERGCSSVSAPRSASSPKTRGPRPATGRSLSSGWASGWPRLCGSSRRGLRPLPPSRRRADGWSPSAGEVTSSARGHKGTGARTTSAFDDP